jgi:general secretion pathway protein F
MKQKTKHKPLSAKELAVLYSKLGRLDESGIPIEKAMTLLLEGGGEISQRATVALNYLKRGRSLSQAGTRAGLFVGLDAAMIRAGEAGGTLTQICRQLAQFYEEKVQQTEQIKSRLFLPVTVLLLAIFIQPFPTLISGNLTITNYLGTTIGVVIQLALLAFILLRFPRWARHSFLRLLGIGRLWDKLEINIPYFGHWIVRRNLRDFVRTLGLLLQAGLPILEALPLAYDVIENTVLRERFRKISRHLRQGDTLTGALSQVKGVNQVAIQLILVGESAGDLANMMLHYVKLESEEISRFDKMLADWIPRMVYVVIAAWIVYGIFSSGAFMPNVPESFF